VTRWCSENASFLHLPPHPSELPYYLHRSVFLRLQDPLAAMSYARAHLIAYVPTQPVLQLITSCLYANTPSKSNGEAESNGNGDGMDIDTEHEQGRATKASPYNHDRAPLVAMFKAEYCRRHGWPKDDPLEVVVDLGSRGGALNAIEKARRVMGERLGRVRTWTDLPVSHRKSPQRNIC
jgi:hypothetical protein